LKKVGRFYLERTFHASGNFARLRDTICWLFIFHVEQKHIRTGRYMKGRRDKVDAGARMFMGSWK
jgi:hypothetical protein